MKEMKSEEPKSLLEMMLSKFDSLKIEKCEELFEEEGIKNFLKDKELVETTKAFLANNLNVCKTSKVTFMHRNTLLYRLEKIKKMTNLDIRKFCDAVTVEVLLTLFKVYGKDKF